MRIHQIMRDHDLARAEIPAETPWRCEVHIPKNTLFAFPTNSESCSIPAVVLINIWRRWISAWRILTTYQNTEQLGCWVCWRVYLPWYLQVRPFSCRLTVACYSTGRASSPRHPADSERKDYTRVGERFM